MTDFWEFEQNEWWCRIAKSPNGDGYIILAKREKFVLPTFEPVLEPGELRFEFGETVNEVLNNMKITCCEFNLVGMEND